MMLLLERQGYMFIGDRMVRAFCPRTLQSRITKVRRWYLIAVHVFLQQLERIRICYAVDEACCNL